MLEVSTGDRVRLVNTNGDTAEVTVARLATGVITTTYHYFREVDGWSVVEVLPKPLPPVGTFVKGVLKDGLKFVGVVRGENHRYPFATVDGQGHTEPMGVHEIESWEVLDV